MTTQHQNTELLPCPFCGGEAHAWERHDKGYSVYGRFWWNVGCKSCLFEMNDREEFKDGLLVHPERECFARWNTRPAKAVQGDLQGMDGHDEPCAKCGVKCNALSSNFTVTPVCLWIGGEFTTHCAKCVIKALTPESEGIAGKGDLEDDDWPDVVAAQRMDIENGYWILIADESIIAENLDESGAKYLEKCVRHYRLTRPQEIDVESLVNEVTDKICTNPEYSKTGMRLVVSGIVQSAIDHLHSSGYLSAPDGKAQITKEQLNLAKDYSCQREKELMACIRDFADCGNSSSIDEVKEQYQDIIDQAQAQKGG